jgi:thiol-disulfide isomerase/thioredoxin
MEMKRFLVLFVLLASLARADATAWLPIEQKVAEAVKAPQVTVVHFWAPWCPNCAAELKKNGWSTFLDSNFDVNFIFVTVWNDEDGHAVLEKNGVGAQTNFQLLLHPNASREPDTKMSTFMGQPLAWIPTTWVFRDGKLRYALNYGEVRFSLLQQLIRDASDKWDRK